MAVPKEKSELSGETKATSDLTHLYDWIKSLEIKLNNLEGAVQLIKTDFYHRLNELNKELKVLSSETGELQREKEKMMEKIGLIIRELKNLAGKEELAVIKKYLEYVNPIKFATYEDVERLIKSRFEELEEKFNK